MRWVGPPPPPGRAGEESAGVSAYRDAAMWAARSMRYSEAKAYLGEGLRYADDIQQSFCGHLMQATSAVIAWASAEWEKSAVEARQALSDRGCRQGANIARWALGFVALGRGDLETATTELEEALAFGEQRASSLPTSCHRSGGWPRSPSLPASRSEPSPDASRR